jgi:ABC-type phosphonate transport system ATPase subunit
VPTLGLAHNLLLTRLEAIAWPALRRLDWGAQTANTQAGNIIARFNVKAGGPIGGRALAVGRQSAKVHCRPRD